MFDISSHDLSAVFWNRLLRLSAWQMPDIASQFSAVDDLFAHERDAMEYKTGSIPLATAVWLTLLADYLEPKRVAEVGTFVGKSAYALAAGMKEGNILTCDASNPEPAWIAKEPFPEVKIMTHPRTTSTVMLAGIDMAIDLFFIDGRVLPEDVEHIRRLSHAKTVIAFDDFEGIEKGVSNAAALRTPAYALIMPPAPNLLLPHGVSDHSTLALLVPYELFRFTNQ